MALATLANYKARCAITITDATRDAALNALIASVSADVAAHCGRVFESGSATEYRNGRGMTGIYVSRLPVTAVTSVHESVSVPRVYDATTLLVAGTDYDYDDATGKFYRMSGAAWQDGEKAVKIVYTGGYATIPPDLEQAVIEIIRAKYEKGIGGQYHLTGVTSVEGNLNGIVFQDWPPQSREVIERYRMTHLAAV